MHGNFAVFSLQMCVTGVQNFLNKTEEKSKNKRCDYEVPGMVLLNDLKGAMRFDRSEDMSVYVSTWINYDFNALMPFMSKL